MIRRPRLSDVSSRTFDAVIIGGGINGTSVARDASLRGMTACVVEMNDFASGTSSRSSKLVHGGIRYLAHGDFRLVHEACMERRRLLSLAPHIVHPLGFIVPVYKGDEHGLLEIKAGMVLYDMMAVFRNVHAHKMYTAKGLRTLEPQLDSEGLRGGAYYYDCQMDDARLCLENALSAREAGAVCLNYARVIGIVKSGGRAVGVEVEDRETGECAELRGHVIVNTTGPWIDDICDLDAPAEKRKVRPTKGVHLIVRPFASRHAVVISSERDGRMFFVLPWHEYTMIGTTDTDHTGPGNQVYATGDDVEYLLTETSRVFPGVSLTPDQVIATYAGLRPLMNQQGMDESDVSREHVMLESESGVVSMIGGKYTTYRAQAEQMVDLIGRRLYPRTFRPCQTSTVPVYGGNTGDLEWYLHEQTPIAARQFDLEPRIVRHVIQQYGSRYRDVLQVIARDPSYRLPLSDSADYLRGEVVYQTEVEFARRVTDVLQRRTRLQLSVGNGIDCAEIVADVMGAALGWTPERREEELAAYRGEVERTQAWRREFPGTSESRNPATAPLTPTTPN